MNIREWSRNQLHLAWVAGLAGAACIGYLLDGYLARKNNPFYGGSGSFNSDVTVACVLIVGAVLTGVTWQWLRSNSRT